MVTQGELLGSWQHKNQTLA